MVKGGGTDDNIELIKDPMLQRLLRLVGTTVAAISAGSGPQGSRRDRSPNQPVIATVFAQHLKAKKPVFLCVFAVLSNSEKNVILLSQSLAGGLSCPGELGCPLRFRWPWGRARHLPVEGALGPARSSQREEKAENTLKYLWGGKKRWKAEPQSAKCCTKGLEKQLQKEYFFFFFS